MNTNARVLEDVKINIKIKLAALWVALMFLYIYADILTFYQPGIIEEIISGKIVGIQINQVFLLGAAILLAIPGIMVCLSLTLKAKANRWANIILGIFHAGVLLTTMFIPIETMESYAHHIFYLIAEAVFIILIVWCAWKWPNSEV